MEIHEETIVRRYIVFDGIRFYPDKKGYWLGQRKDSKKPVRLHVYVWEYYNGPIPKGYHVHHKDFNPDNNEIENLELIEKSEHLKYHAQFQDAEWARRNLMKNALPAAAEWHRSPEGRAWHSKHAKEVTTPKMLSDVVEKKCAVCGKLYTVPKVISTNSRFCSNNCRAQYRRDSGIDNIQYPCEICGTLIWTNKYAKKRFCSDECRAINLRKKWDKRLEERRNAKDVVGNS